MKVVILAGGRGTRLAPYTSVLPKPLMPIGNQTILEIVIEQLVRQGFGEIVLCVGHLSHLIEAVLNNGRPFGAELTYVKESEPLGTAGPLRAIPELRSRSAPFLVMNGDVLTSLDYGALLNQHLKSQPAMTIATHQRVNTVDYGILELGARDNGATRVVGFLEKPEFRLDVSMGVYVLEPHVLDLIPAGEYFDIPDLVHAVLACGEDIGAYRFDGFWLDIGRPEDYDAAGALWAEAVGSTLIEGDERANGHREPSPRSNGSVAMRGTPSSGANAAATERATIA